MIFSLLIIHNHNRKSTRVLHTTTWFHFTSRLPDRFIRSPKVVKETIMTDINNLVEESWRTSRTSFFAMLRLLEILHCINILEVRFVIISFFVTAIDLAEKIYRSRQIPSTGALAIPLNWTLTKLNSKSN